MSFDEDIVFYAGRQLQRRVADHEDREYLSSVFRGKYVRWSGSVYEVVAVTGIEPGGGPHPPHLMARGILILKDGRRGYSDDVLVLLVPPVEFVAAPDPPKSI